LLTSEYSSTIPPMIEVGATVRYCENVAAEDPMELRASLT
jgi:hypothetical protein